MSSPWAFDIGLGAKGTLVEIAVRKLGDGSRREFSALSALSAVKNAL